jgi:hypothetical protein
MPLPDELVIPLRKEVDRLHHPNNMPYATNFERLARKKVRRRASLDAVTGDVFTDAIKHTKRLFQSSAERIKRNPRRANS